MDGDLTGLLAVPGGPAPAPVVIVVHEVEGYCPSTEAAALRLAAAGYLALAVDLYAPYGGAPRLTSRDDTVGWVRRLDDHRQVSDLALALEWLARRPGADPELRGAVGFSIGGRYALLLGTEPQRFDAVVTFYTRPWPNIADPAVLVPSDYGEQVRPAVCSFFGEDDDVVPSDMVERFRRSLDRRAGHEVHLLPGRHLFANEGRPRRYRRSSAELAWAEALRFLGHHLGRRGTTSVTTGPRDHSDEEEHR